jgi:two-component system, cell cycle sensor histidine kinase and response regulator CckA
MHERFHIAVGSRVIVADDDEALRMLLSETLSEEGFEVLLAADGLEALELYQKNADTISLVVADIIMPRMDGLTAAIEMRKIDENVAFLFMSGCDPERIRAIGISIEEIPNSCFFPKPFGFEEMVNEIRKPGSGCRPMSQEEITAGCDRDSLSGL